MKVLFINSVCGGSTGRIASGLAKMLTERGDEALFCYGRRAAAEGVDTYRICNDLAVKVHAAYARLTDRQGFFGKRSTQRLIKRIETFSPDIIHLHNIHGYYLDLPVLFDYLSNKNIPVVWTLHDCWSMTGHCAYFDPASCEKWRTRCNHCPEKTQYPASLVADNAKKNHAEKERMFTSLSHAVIVTPSHWLAQVAEQSYLSRYPVKVIENGVDLTVFCQSTQSRETMKEQFGIAGKKVVFGAAAPWDRRKGLDDLIALADRLPNQYQIVLAGLTKKQLRHLPKSILGLPHTKTAADLALLYNMADVYVNPTYADNFPTTNIEALCCGVPVIAYQTGGACEAFDENTGIAVKRGDLNGLKQAVESACGRLDRRECAARGSTFDRRTRFLPYLRLYDELMQQ